MILKGRRIRYAATVWSVRNVRGLRQRRNAAKSCHVRSVKGPKVISALSIFNVRIVARNTVKDADGKWEIAMTVRYTTHMMWTNVKSVGNHTASNADILDAVIGPK